MTTTEQTIEREVMTGNDAVASAVMQAHVDGIAAYPITPSTALVSALALAVETGKLDTNFISVESEHSAMSGCMGIVAAGGRAFTATAAHGLMYMAEQVFWAGYGRLPMVMAVVNRALAPGWSILCDHQDALAMRDAGWGQFFVKNNQEAYDTLFQAYKVAEDHDVYVPFMESLDAFILSHSAAPVQKVTQRVVDDFLPNFDPIWKLDVDDPQSYGPLVDGPAFSELREALMVGIDNARPKIRKANQEWAEVTGRDYGGLVEVYGPEDADIGIVSMGTIAEEVEVAVDMMNKQGMSVGATRVRAFRPFPVEEIAEMGRRYGSVLVIDRDSSFGHKGVLHIDTQAALYENNIHVPMKGIIRGLGGKEVHYTDIIREVQEFSKEK